MHVASASQSTATQSRPDQHRYQALVLRYQRDLYRFAMSLCHDHHTAEDLVQETLLRAWRSIHQLHDVEAARSWLFTIVRRENARRFERKRPELSDVETDTVADDYVHQDTSTEAWQLHRALERLPDDYREPLLLQVIGGYGYQEIAERMKLSTAAVTSRLFRARQKLHGMLAEPVAA